MEVFRRYNTPKQGSGESRGEGGIPLLHPINDIGMYIRVYV